MPSPAYLPTPPMEQHYSMNGYPSAAVADDKPVSSYDDQPVRPSYQSETSYGYEPPAYQPYQPDDEPAAAPEDEQKPKKKSFMDDDDDDDLAAKAAALKKQQKSEADRQADEAFRKAAEADGKCSHIQSIDEPEIKANPRSQRPEEQVAQQGPAVHGSEAGSPARSQTPTCRLCTKPSSARRARSTTTRILVDG
jgi:hypothetical protein